MIINGKIKRSKDTFNVINPFTNDNVEEVSNSSNEDVQSALTLSSEFKCNLSIEEKESILIKTAETLKENKEDFATTISYEAGLSMKDSLYEIGRVINCANYAAKVCKFVNRDITKDFIYDDVNKPTLRVIKEPLDLVVAITPFNHPMNQVAHKIFPGIIAGASIVLKPSEKTPISAIRLVKTLIDNGLPPNMINVITSNKPKEIMGNILSFPNIDMVTFTGGLDAGLDIKKSMIENHHLLKKYVPELGGSSSLIICSDGQIDDAVRIILNGCFKNSGQRCTSIRRVVVEESVADNLINKLLLKVKKLKYGNPLDFDTDIGTVIDENAAKKIQKRINSAIRNGAELIYGNIREGALLSPTILDKVNLSMEIVSEETFGPVCPIIRVSDFSEALEVAKNTKYQLAGGIVTKDHLKAEEASKYLQVGQFSFNGPPSYRTEVAPFGGFGASGNGEKEGILFAAMGMQRVRTFYDHN